MVLVLLIFNSKHGKVLWFKYAIRHEPNKLIDTDVDKLLIIIQNTTILTLYLQFHNKERDGTK